MRVRRRAQRRGPVRRTGYRPTACATEAPALRSPPHAMALHDLHLEPLPVGFLEDIVVRAAPLQIPGGAHESPPAGGDLPLELVFAGRRRPVSECGVLPRLDASPRRPCDLAASLRGRCPPCSLTALPSARPALPALPRIRPTSLVATPWGVPVLPPPCGEPGRGAGTRHAGGNKQASRQSAAHHSGEQRPHGAARQWPKANPGVRKPQAAAGTSGRQHSPGA